MFHVVRMQPQLSFALAWQLADEPGPVGPGAAPRVPSVPAPGVDGDAHAEVLVGGESLEAGAAESGERRGHVVAERERVHEMMMTTRVI